MKIVVEMISKEIIKPSTPTPDYHRHYQLSLLDQKAVSVHIPFLYFFDVNGNLRDRNISDDLKVSLSKVLTHYYPLAGYINFEDDCVDCNDRGVIFLEAQINCQLSEIIQDPELPNEFNRFLPYDNIHDRELQLDVCFAIQVNYFKCGSVAIGVLMSHKIADFSSLLTFMKNWAATARGDSDNLSIEFVGASLFPAPKDVLGISAHIPHTWNNVELRRFLFSNSKIASLKEEYTSSSVSPTRVEALSAFIWSRFVASTKINMRPELSSMIVHPVDLRNKMDRPLPKDSFGNFVGMAITFLTDNTREESQVHNLVKQFRDSIRKVNKDFVQNLQNENIQIFDICMKENGEKFMKGEIVSFCFSSISTFPIYDVDFGWGRPKCVAFGGYPFQNSVVLINTKDGDGIEAWMILAKEDMEKFESDVEILAYISPTSQL